MINKEEFKIREGRPEDAEAISKVVQMAMHEECCLAFAGTEERLLLVDETFTILAGRPDSQYSYRNTLVAEDAQGNVAGAIVSYDGARMHELRQAFVEVANRVMDCGFVEAEMDNETSDDEIYLDSLAVFPAYRGNGLARKLMDAACRRHASAGKPFGLLCAPGNDDAYALYGRLGFQEIGLRPFAGITMRHMVRR